jgi:[protein-PII] uridylyltransferase
LVQTHAKNRASLAATDAALKSRFLAGESVVDLVHDRAAAIDELLRDLWHTHMGKLSEDMALVAVGGYGRGELHPCSDVDIMLLLPESIDADAEQALSAFITSLWDVRRHSSKPCRKR